MEFRIEKASNGYTLKVYENNQQNMRVFYDKWDLIEILRNEL